MTKTFAVIGLGIFGRTICEVLVDKGAEVIAIDNNETQIKRVKDIVTQAILLDSTDEDSLNTAPFDQVDAAIIAIGDNIESSILTTTLLKQLGVPYIIARAVNKTHYQVLKKLGADEVINIEEDQGNQVALNLVAPLILKKIQLSKNIVLSEIYLPKMFVEAKAEKLSLKESYNLNLTAIRRIVTALDSDGNTVREEELILPQNIEKLIENDILIIIGEEKDIDKFIKNTES